jgi:hypothetical protein
LLTTYASEEAHEADEFMADKQTSSVYCWMQSSASTPTASWCCATQQKGVPEPRRIADAVPGDVVMVSSPAALHVLLLQAAPQADGKQQRTDVTGFFFTKAAECLSMVTTFC